MTYKEMAEAYRDERHETDDWPDALCLGEVPPPRMAALAAGAPPARSADVAPMLQTESSAAPGPTTWDIDLNGGSEGDAVAFCSESPEDVRALRAAGYRAVCNPDGVHGLAAYVGKLRGHDVGILPGHGEPGRYRASQLHLQLSGKTRSVVILHSVADGLGAWLDAGNALEELRAFVTEKDEADEPIPDEPYECFPVDVLPQTVREFTASAAFSIGCDESFIVLPLISSLGAAIGNTRRIEMKRDWREPPIFWTATVAESGQRKSPPFTKALEPLNAIQAELFREHRKSVQGHESALLQYEQALRAWKKSQTGAPPAKPEEPRADQIIVSDTTVEALLVIQEDNPRGVLLARDELGGWLRGFDRYKRTSGSDSPQWNEMFSGRPCTVNRKTGDHQLIHVERAATCICGNIQPGTLRRCLGEDLFESGLVARLLFAMPPKRRRTYNPASVPVELRRRVEAVCRELHSLKFGRNDSGDPHPISIPLDPDARRRFEAYIEENSAEMWPLEPHLSAAWSKREGYVLRFALLFYLLKSAERVVMEKEELEEIRLAAERSGLPPADIEACVRNEELGRVMGRATEEEEAEKAGEPDKEATTGEMEEGKPEGRESGTSSYKEAVQPEESIPLADIEAAIRVVEWFKVQDRRVYARMAASEADAKIEDVTDLIKATGGRLSVRDLMRSRHRYRTNRDMAQEVLDRIVERGEARWQEEPNPRGGRRRRYVELVDPAPDCRI